MSCDFAVWSARRRRTSEEAHALYGRICDGAAAGLDPDPAVDAFYAELTARHPEIDSLPEAQVDRSPWSARLDRSAGHVAMSVVWSRAGELETRVRDLARKHRLAVYDPQRGTIEHPDDAVLTVEAGTRRVVPSIQEVGSALATLGAGGGGFAILERGDERSMQTAVTDPARFVVEYRDGSAAEHFRSEREDLSLEEVTSLFSAYLAGDPVFRRATRWRRLGLDPSPGPG